MLNGPSKRRLTAVSLLLAAVVLALGSGNRDEAAEVLDHSVNHYCGDLVMVTIDTSALGFQYLNPAISPDGTRVAFTADWSAIPSAELPEPVLNRQILIMPLPADPWADAVRNRKPVLGIRQLGAELVYVRNFVSLVGGSEVFVTEADRMDKGQPLWIDDSTLLFLARFSRRDRLMIGDISDPARVDPRVVFYEPDDLLPSGGMIYYHNDPALSRDGRWLLFTRFGCDGLPNFDDVNCTRESLWVLDMTTIADPTAVVPIRLTSDVQNLEDPAWHPDGDLICFAATTDMIGQYGGTITELFSITFDPDAAAAGEAVIDRDLRRLTTTEVTAGDPIVGLHNYAPTFDLMGSEIYFVSSRRAPATTLRARSIWRIPFDGRLEPQLLFYSRRDDVHPTFHRQHGAIMLSSRMGFPTSMLDWFERSIIDSLTALGVNPVTDLPYTEVEIIREARDRRRELEFYEDVMSHLYLFRRF